MVGMLIKINFTFKKFNFRASRTILNANVPLLSVYLSNAARGRQNSPLNTEIVSSNGQFLCADAASFD